MRLLLILILLLLFLSGGIYAVVEGLVWLLIIAIILALLTGIFGRGAFRRG